MHMFVNLDESELIIKPGPNDDSKDIPSSFKRQLERDEKGLDFIEYGIINVLTLHFGLAWQAPKITLETPHGTRSHGSSMDPTDRIKLSQAEIRSIFSDNPFIKKYIGLTVALPARGKIERIVATSRLASENELQKLFSRMRRTISISTPESRIDILLSYSGGGGVTPAIPDIFGSRQPGGGPIDKRFSITYYDVEIKGAFSKLLPISWNRKESLKRWHEHIADVLETFDWKSVNAQLKEDRTQKALELMLETNKVTK